VNDPDSIVEYVRSLDRRHQRTIQAIREHRTNKEQHAIEGTIDGFDRQLWATITTEDE